MNEIFELKLYVAIIIALLLLSQVSWIFYDASKRGENKWLWGIFGLLNVPSSLIIYLIVTRVVLKTKSCENCNNRMKVNATYCPHCGKKAGD